MNVSSLSTAPPRVRPFWNPLLAGLALGLVLLGTFVATGHGLGATGASTRLSAWLGGALAPQTAAANGYLGPLLEAGNPLPSWITWQVLGVALGAFVSAWMAGRFRWQLDGLRSIGPGRRAVTALLGGVVSGFGARVAAGCTSGLGLSGAATLAVAAFVFLATFFAAGLLASRWVRGI